MSDAALATKPAADPLLARLVAMHREQPQLPPVIVRYFNRDGNLQFAAIIDRFGERAKVRNFSDGAEHWIEACDIEAAAR